MTNKIVVLGATGFLGQRIAFELSKKYNIVCLIRNLDKAHNIYKDAANISFILWDPTHNGNQIKDSLNGAFAVINLAGENIGNKRWSEKYKQIIYNSRIQTTRELVKLMNEVPTKPETLISASAIGFYGVDNENTVADEGSPAGNDYLARLCLDWETEARKSLTQRVVIIRIGVVLDKTEGAFIKLVRPFKFYLGGIIGHGQQWMPWIHIEDLIRLFIFAVENSSLHGAINACSPNPVTNEEFSRTIAAVLHKPCIFKIPKFALKILFGEFATYLIKGKKVVPQKTLEVGFIFDFTDIKLAVENLLSGK
ncbi:MAG: TIGR01777 family oxidoreductase [Ignavibacteria bacterium]